VRRNHGNITGAGELGKRLLGRRTRGTAAAGGAWKQARLSGRRRDADVAVLSPVDGEVVATGGPDQDWYLN
jgi:hypothetical protein